MTPEMMSRHVLRTHGVHAALQAAMRADFWHLRGNVERSILWGKVDDLIRQMLTAECGGTVH